MGEDKSFLTFSNKTLIEYQYDRLSKIFSNVYISSKTNKFDFDCDIIYDKDQSVSSPMVALGSIFDFITTQKVFIITVDTPLITHKTLNTLLEKSIDYDITIATNSNKVHNLCGVFSKKLNVKIDEYLEQDMHKINYLIKNTKSVRKVLFDDTKEFININTKNDYARLKS